MRFGRMRRVWKNVNPVRMIVGGAASLLVTLFVYFSVGSPVATFHILTGRVPIPPQWLFILLDFLCRTGLGAAVGTVSGSPLGFRDGEPYRGSFFGVLSLAAGSFFYTSFFGGNYFLFAAIFAAVETLCGVNTAIAFRRCGFFPFLSALALTAWALIRTCISLFSVFFV